MKVSLINRDGLLIGTGGIPDEKIYPQMVRIAGLGANEPRLFRWVRANEYREITTITWATLDQPTPTTLPEAIQLAETVFSENEQYRQRYADRQLVLQFMDFRRNFGGLTPMVEHGQMMNSVVEMVLRRLEALEHKKES